MMERSVLNICGQIMQEVSDSIKKHGDWSDYTVDQMQEALVAEWVAVLDADIRMDITGRHGSIRELIQVAACLVKLLLQLEVRMKFFCDDGHEWFGECLPAVCPKCHMPAIGAR